MKKLFIIISSAIALSACNSGSSGTPSGINLYGLQNYQFKAVQSGNCQLQGDSNLNCDSAGTFGGLYEVTFDGGTSAYVEIPPNGNTYGVNISETGTGCSQSAAESGTTYTCQFKMATNGTAQAGNTINIQVNGNLGRANIVQVNLQ